MKIIFHVFWLCLLFSLFLLRADNPILFQEMQRIETRNDEDDVIGYIDRKGKEIFSLPSSNQISYMPEQWTNRYFAGDLVLLWSRAENCPVYLDRTGKVMIKTTFTEAHQFSEGLAVVTHSTHNARPWLEKEPWFGYIDQTGKIVIPLKFDHAGDFHEGLAVVGMNKDQVHATYGYIDNKGEYVVQPQFDFACDFHEGCARVKNNSGFGFINKKGEFILKPQFGDARDFHGGLAAVWLDHKWEYIDKTGAYVIRPIFNDSGLWHVGDFHDERAIVSVETTCEKFGVIDTKGEFIVKPIYDRIEDYSEGLACVFIDGKYGFIDVNGDLIIKPKFDSVDNFFNGLAGFYKNEGEEFGYIDHKGNIVWHSQPTHYSEKNN
jgi:hypothetical protein